MGTKATPKQKAAYADREHKLYQLFAQGERDPEAVLDDLQAVIEGKHLGGGSLLPILEYSEAVKAAAEIMGTNFHGPEAAYRHLGAQFLPEYHEAAAAMPFSPEVLEECKDTHLLVWLAPLALMAIWDRQTELFYSKSDPWYGRRPERPWSTKVKIMAGWWLVRKSVVPGSLNKTWDEQQALLDPVEETPPSSAVAQAADLHFLETGERILPDCYVRTSDVDSDGRRVRLGGFDGDGLHVYSYWDDDRRSLLGLASSRKSS
jgi:hypothetical protein